MKYKIDENENQLDIKVKDTSDNKEKLLQAFQECQQGRCSCPTDEYKKLDRLEVNDVEDGVELHLKSKAGTKFNADEINKCLEHTAKQIEKDKS